MGSPSSAALRTAEGGRRQALTKLLFDSSKCSERAWSGVAVTDLYEDSRFRIPGMKNGARGSDIGQKESGHESGHVESHKSTRTEEVRAQDLELQGPKIRVTRLHDLLEVMMLVNLQSGHANIKRVPSEWNGSKRLKAARTIIY
eukprot:1734863-Pleurochrysis_carterae.AAC.3